MSFRQAAARFSAEVERALTRARRAARDARAESADFRRRTEELTTQAKSGKLRRAQATPTNREAQAEAVKFRAANGLPVPDVPTAEQLTAGVPQREPVRAPRKPENDDFSEHQVLFDVDKDAREGRRTEPAGIDSPEPEATPRGETEDDFSHQRILLDAAAESYRPDEVLQSVFDVDDRENRR